MTDATIASGDVPDERIASQPGARASDVVVAGVSHAYAGDDVLRDVSLAVGHGELVTLLGPSGSGKSTLLRIVGGLERPRAGRVEIGGGDVTRLPPEKREVGIVFQNYALFPHMTVAENVAFPLRMRKLGGKQAAPRVRTILETVELEELAKRYPAELSGGQQQRVALARALVFVPRVLLLDEPFGALDRRLREQLGLEVRRVQRELGITTIFVTHDQDEAFTMSTRIAVMGGGRILQADAPAAVYGRPATLEVARYLGALNDFPVTVAGRNDAAVELAGPGGLRLRTRATGDLAADLRCGVRPERVRLASEPDGVCTVPAVVQAAIFGGDWTRAQVVIGDAPPLLATLAPGALPIADGDRVYVGVDGGDALLFDAATGARVG
jgi:ABC-type Fe3+/spermidine/putrescine transport system ATPase subunit